MLNINWRQPGIIHYFLVFLILACLLPFFLASALLLNSVNRQAVSQRKYQLDTSLFLVREEIRTSIEHTLLTAEESALEFEDELRESAGRPLTREQIHRLMSEARRKRRLDFIILLDSEGRAIVGTPQHKHILDVLRKERFSSDRENIWAGFDLLPVSEGSEKSLFMVAGIPVYLSEHGDREGKLIFGKRASEILDNIDYVENISGLKLQLHLLDPAHPSQKPPDVPGRKDSRMLLLRDAQEEAIARIVIEKTPTNATLVEDEILYVLVYLLTVTFLIGLAGFWFYRYVLNPIQQIMQATSRVANNELHVRVNSPYAKGEILRQTFQQFNRMVTQLESNEKSRNAFITSITHDLRTPLQSEKRVLELFQEFRDELPEQFAKLVDNLKDSNLYLLDMINTLLEVYRYEAGKVSIDYERIIVSALLREVFTQLAPLSEKKQIRMEWQGDDEIAFKADRQQIKRLLINLIGNAIENIPKGCLVQVSAAHEMEYIHIRIRDNGPGMPNDQLAGLFERYYTSANKSKKIGSGLGLYICKCIVDAHQGTITIDSHEQAGTRIAVRLPSDPPESRTG